MNHSGGTILTDPFSKAATTITLANRRKWNERYQHKMSAGLYPEPHFLARDWAGRFQGGRMLDAACGLGRGIASAGEHFHTIYAVDSSEVAVRMARQYWADKFHIHWLVSDVTQLAWPEDFFHLVCAFGFTDFSFFGRLETLVAPGGMFLYEGFSERQREERPDLNPAWTTTPKALEDLFENWEMLACGETGGPPYRVHLAAVRPE